MSEPRPEKEVISKMKQEDLMRFESAKGIA